jgi:hypothetical protein
MTWDDRVDALVDLMEAAKVGQPTLGAISADLKDLHSAIERVATLLEEALAADDPAEHLVDIDIEIDRHFVWHRRSLSKATKKAGKVLTSRAKGRRKGRKKSGSIDRR